MTRTGYSWEMSNTPNPDYPNPKRLAGMMHSFDYVVTGKEQVHAINEEFRKVNAAEELEALKQIGIDDPPTFTYVERLKETHRSLILIEMARYIRDSIRLRKYNEEWIKNNLH